MRGRTGFASGFTLIELMVVVAVAGLLVLLVAPSFRDMIVINRLRGVNAQLVTDLQFGRSEAVSRARAARFNLGTDGNQTCYVIYVAVANSTPRCDCTLGAGAACTDANATEIRTVSVQRSSQVTLNWPVDAETGFGFDHVTGGLISIPNDMASAPLESVQIDTRIDDDRRLRNRVVQTGRVSVCAPNPQRMQVAAC